MPKISTATSGSTSTVTSSAATRDPSTTTTTAGSTTEAAEAAEASASKNDETKPGNTFAGIGFNKLGSVLRIRIEEIHPSQAFTVCSTWYG